MYTKFEDLFKQLPKERKKLVIAVGQDENSLEAAYTAHKNGVIELICTGNREEILKLANENQLDFSQIKIIDEKDKKKAVEIAVKLINDGEAQILMKGNVSTSLLLKGVLNKDWGLRAGKLLSHFSIFELENYHKLLAITDVAMNIAPNLADKVGIIENAVNYMSRIGINNPKVAIVTAVESVKENMPQTLDAAVLAKMAERNQIKNCIIDGPLAMDNAISMESAKHKKIESEVAGDADLLIVPTIEAGNILYKALGFLANSKLAAVILGAEAPIVLTSRADSEEDKLYSIYLACLGAK